MGSLLGTAQDQEVQPRQVTSIKAQFLEVSPAGSPGSQIGSLAGSNEYPVLESNSDFFVLLEPYSEIFEK